MYSAIATPTACPVNIDANTANIVLTEIIIGKIIETKKNISKILLLTDSRTRLLAMVQNETNSQGVLRGTYGLTLKMEWIPKNDVVIQGQYVITSGLEEKIPKGLIVGQIETVSLKTGALFQEASIRPLVSYNQLQIVAIITS